MQLLVTTDGSERSFRVFPHAARFAKATGASVTLARALDPLIDCGGELAVKLDAAIERVSNRWREELAAAAAARGLEAEVAIWTHVHGEDTAGCLERMIAGHGFDILAMETRGAGAVRHALFGSVAMRVLGHAKLPVMVTGPEATSPPTGDGYNVLATTDLSAGAGAVFPLLKDLAARPGLAVTLAHVAATGEAADARAALERVRDGLAAPVAIEVREVPPGAGIDTAIIAEAATIGASLIVMATHGHSALRHLVAGSVALGVVSRAPVPVLLVPVK
ncbi:MAG: universal stress protein [Dehalococcoidia bacterium]